MKPGRPIPPMVLSDEEKAELEKTVRQRTAAHSDVQRARVILLCAQGLPNYRVAEQTCISSLSVGRWRQRFVQDRLRVLLDQPRSGAPRTISDAQVAEVVRTTLEKRPKNATHWSTRSLAGKLGLSHDSIARIWKAFGLQPHRHEHFQFSTDPEFVDKVRDVVGLYMSPPQNAVVLCLDEKSQCQALERTQPILPLRIWCSLACSLPVQGETVTRCHVGAHDGDIVSILRAPPVRAAASSDKGDGDMTWMERSIRCIAHSAVTK